MPLYPTSDYRFENDLQEINGKKRVIFIYERGTLMEVLANVTGSYMWSTTTNARLKAAYGWVCNRFITIQLSKTGFYHFTSDMSLFTISSAVSSSISVFVTCLICFFFRRRYTNSRKIV